MRPYRKEINLKEEIQALMQLTHVINELGNNFDPRSLSLEDLIGYDEVLGSMVHGLIKMQAKLQATIEVYH